MTWKNRKSKFTGSFAAILDHQCMEFWWSEFSQKQRNTIAGCTLPTNCVPLGTIADTDILCRIAAKWDSQPEDEQKLRHAWMRMYETCDIDLARLKIVNTWMIDREMWDRREYIPDDTLDFVDDFGGLEVWWPTLPAKRRRRTVLRVVKRGVPCNHLLWWTRYRIMKAWDSLRPEEREKWIMKFREANPTPESSALRRTSETRHGSRD